MREREKVQKMSRAIKLPRPRKTDWQMPASIRQNHRISPIGETTSPPQSERDYCRRQPLKKQATCHSLSWQVKGPMSLHRSSSHAGETGHEVEAAPIQSVPAQRTNRGPQKQRPGGKDAVLSTDTDVNRSGENAVSNVRTAISPRSENRTTRPIRYRAVLIPEESYQDLRQGRRQGFPDRQHARADPHVRQLPAAARHTHPRRADKGM